MKTASVADRFGAASDPGMAMLGRALDPGEASRLVLRACGPVLLDATELHAIRVARHKPGRRCVVEYEFGPSGAWPHGVTLVGKARAKGVDKRTPIVLRAAWNAGFDAASVDGISVPQFAGMVPEFQMWFQVKVPGIETTELLANASGTELVRRIAEAAHKLHQAVIPTERSHSSSDEIRILEERLARVALIRPEWSERLDRVLKASATLAASLPTGGATGIHRDFYPAQVLQDGPRLWLLDFDLFCRGDPALDIGNFIGHLTEQSLRVMGEPDRLSDLGRAMAERFTELSGDNVRSRVDAYEILTLVRHIELSTRIPGREGTTARLLELCERRLEV